MLVDALQLRDLPVIEAGVLMTPPRSSFWSICWLTCCRFCPTPAFGASHERLPVNPAPLLWHHWPVSLRIGAVLILVHLLLAAIGPFAAPTGKSR